MPDRPKALVLTAEMAHQDPRVSWNLEILSRNYDVTVAPGTDCLERAALDFYSKHHVLPCGRLRLRNLSRQVREFLQIVFSLPGICLLAARATVRDPRAVWEVIGLVCFRQPAAAWLFSVGKCLKMHAAVWPFIRNHEYDLVWCHEFLTLPTGLRYRQGHPRCKIVWDEHEIGLVPPLTRCQWAAAEQIAAFVSVSDPILEHQVQALPPLRTKAHCVPNVPSLSRTPLHAPVGEIVRWVIIGMESMHLIQSLHHFFSVWGRVAPPHCTLDCYLMQNTTRSYVRSQAFDSVQLKGVTFHDPVPSDRLAERLRTYDVGVAPYFLQGLYRQASPNKVGEYIHAGLAVLVNSDLEWYAGVVERLGCGISANIADVESARNAIERLSDRSTVDGFKRRSCEAARASWNYDTAVAPLIARLQDASLT